MSTPLLSIKGLEVHFPVMDGTIFKKISGVVKAVDGLDLDIYPGETVGLVGESGCGKSTTGRAILNLVRPTSGTVEYQGVDLSRLTEGEMRAYRSKLQIIFQDPYASLNPRMTVEDIVGEPISEYNLVAPSKRRGRIQELMELVGLDPSFSRRYPHEFSGGQRQRIGIARALALEPEFIVCDEPVSALDVSIQAQVVNLLNDLQSKFSLTYLFIAHDLAVVRHISTRVAVMYLGRLVELAPAAELYERQLHPYTRALISAVPVPDPKIEQNRQRIILGGDVPSPMSPPEGCSFHTRCPFTIDICRQQSPKLKEYSKGHSAACHRLDEIPPI